MVYANYLRLHIFNFLSEKKKKHLVLKSESYYLSS